MIAKYIDVLKKYNVTSFYHFSSIRNLESILINGICNRNYMKLNGIDFVCSDINRYDMQLSCISLSVGSINKNMFLKKSYLGTNDWIIFELDAERLILDFVENMYFCKYNAASTAVIELLKNNKSYLNSVNAFLNMFDENGNLLSQAEILFENNISIDYVKCIYVENLQLKLIVSELLKEHNLSKINVVIKREMF